MGRKRFKVALEVLSNMDGDPPDGEEEKLIKSYLENLNGIGEIKVIEVDRVGRPIRNSLTESLAFTEEAPTTKRAGVKGSRGSRRSR